MITLMLLRHFKAAKAVQGIADHERPLDRRGRDAGAAMAHYLRGLPIHPSLVLCSSARRTRESLDAVRSALPADVLVRHEPGLYGGGMGANLDLLRIHGGDHATLLLVGHNPDVQDLAHGLAGGGDPTAIARVRAKYPPGGLAILTGATRTWADLGPGSLVLAGFVG